MIEKLTYIKVICSTATKGDILKRIISLAAVVAVTAVMLAVSSLSSAQEDGQYASEEQ